MLLRFLSASALLLPLLFQPAALTAQEGSLIEISGKVTDHDKKEPLADVSVQVKGTVSGTITNKNGDFVLRTKSKLPFTLVFSSIGFNQQEFEVKSLGSDLQIELATQTVLGNEVVVTASRVAESILKSPVAIEKLDIRALKETPAASFYDALGNVKGLQLTTSSITFNAGGRTELNMVILNACRSVELFRSNERPAKFFASACNDS